MIKSFLAGAAITALMAVPGWAQQCEVDFTDAEIETARMLGQKGMQDRFGYRLTERLTTEIGPRQAGSEAEARARDWAVQEMLGMGLENVRVEEFEIDGWQRGKEYGEIVAPYPQPLYITLLGGSVATPLGGLTAEVVYFESYDALIESPESGLDGKIVYIDGKMIKSQTGFGYVEANRKRRTGAQEAAKRGAAAVVIRSVGTDSHRFPHTGQMSYADDVPKIPAAAVSGPDADQIARIAESGQTMTFKLDLQSRDMGRLPSGNVVGELRGSTRPDEVVLLGAHLDSWDQGTGAVDDGAGIGIISGAVKLMIDAGIRPERTIRLVYFGSEENGIWGGRAYVEQNAAELENIVIATESDFGAERVWRFQTGVHESALPVTKVIGRHLTDLMVDPGANVERSGGPDIFPMAQKGVPVVRLNQDGTDYFDLHHTPDDTFDKIDPDAMAQNVAAYALFSYMAASTETDFRGCDVHMDEAAQ